MPEMKIRMRDGSAGEKNICPMVENSNEQGAVAQERQGWTESVCSIVSSGVMTPHSDATAFYLDAKAGEVLTVSCIIGLDRYPAPQG
ncbi:MAG: hypothetical protein ACOX6U_09320 [Oscillospiraceae bacterium]